MAHDMEDLQMAKGCRSIHCALHRVLSRKFLLGGALNMGGAHSEREDFAK